jgi:hypothetical protein
MSISAACWEAGVGPINAPVALLHLSGYTVRMFEWDTATTDHQVEAWEQRVRTIEREISGL